MASIQNFNPSTLSLDGATVGIDPYTSGNQTNDFQSVGEGTHVIAAGKYRVRIHNTGICQIAVRKLGCIQSIRSRGLSYLVHHY